MKRINRPAFDLTDSVEARSHHMPNSRSTALLVFGFLVAGNPLDLGVPVEFAAESLGDFGEVAGGEDAIVRKIE